MSFPLTVLSKEFCNVNHESAHMCLVQCCINKHVGMPTSGMPLGVKAGMPAWVECHLMLECQLDEMNNVCDFGSECREDDKSNVQLRVHVWCSLLQMCIYHDLLH